MPVENDIIKAKGGVVLGAGESSPAELSAGKLKETQVPLVVEHSSKAILNPLDFGAVGLGTTHPLSGLYSTLAEAQAVYPFVTSLAQERDYAALQAAYNALPEGENIQLNPPVGGGDGINYRIKGGGVIKAGNLQYYIGTSSIELTANSFIDGRGTIIHYTGTKDAFIRKGNNPYAFWRANGKGLTVFSDYTETSPTSGGRHAFNCLRMSDSHWEDILIYGFASDGFVIPGGQWNHLSEVNCIYNGGYGFRTGDGVELETELTSEISSSATTLPVSATVEVTTGLEARIGGYYGEEVTYTGRTGTSLTGVVRGVNKSRNREWPAGTKVFIMQAQSANNNVLERCRGEVNGRGGWFCDRGHANTAPGSTMQFSGRETKLIEELTIPGELTKKSSIKVESTEGFAPSGIGILTGTAESEIFSYEEKNGTEFLKVLRGMKGYSAAIHTIAGTAVRQGIGVHFRGGENFSNSYYGHLEGNTWHSFIEAYEINEETGLPRGNEILAFFVSSNKCERYLVNQGDATVVGGSTQANIESNLKRNGTIIPFENYWVNATGGGNLSIVYFPKINTPASQQLVTDQLGTSLEEGYSGRGVYVGGPLFLGKYNEPLIYARLSNGANRKIFSMGSSSLLQYGNTQLAMLLQGTEVTLGKSGEKVATYGATPVARAASIGEMATTAPALASYGYTETQAKEIISKLNSAIKALKNFGITE